MATSLHGVGCPFPCDCTGRVHSDLTGCGEPRRNKRTKPAAARVLGPRWACLPTAGSIQGRLSVAQVVRNTQSWGKGSRCTSHGLSGSSSSKMCGGRFLRLLGFRAMQVHCTSVCIRPCAEH